MCIVQGLPMLRIILLVQRKVYQGKRKCNLVWTPPFITLDKKEKKLLMQTLKLMILTDLRTVYGEYIIKLYSLLNLIFKK